MMDRLSPSRARLHRNRGLRDPVCDLYHALILLLLIMIAPTIGHTQPAPASHPSSTSGTGNPTGNPISNPTVTAVPSPSTRSEDDNRDTAEGGEDLRTTLSREIAQLTTDIDTLEQLMRWQDDLMRTARVDRAEALRQRRPMDECRSSALSTLCDQLVGLFRPERPAEGTEDTDDFDKKDKQE